MPDSYDGHDDDELVLTLLMLTLEMVRLAVEMTLPLFFFFDAHEPDDADDADDESVLALLIGG